MNYLIQTKKTRWKWMLLLSQQDYFPNLDEDLFIPVATWGLKDKFWKYVWVIQRQLFIM